MNSALTVDVSPYLPVAYVYGLGAVAVLFFLLSLFYHRSGIIIRAVCAAVFVLLLMNPSIVREEREPVTDIAVAVVDRSPSQDFANRKKRADSALALVKKKIGAIPGMELRVVESPGGLQQETRLFEELDQAVSDVPESRRAGAILITDGQVHDVPADAQRLAGYGPVNALITADRNERDRQLVIMEAPSYGIVGQAVNVRYRVEDNDPQTDGFATIVIRQDDGSPARTLRVPVNEDQGLPVTVSHAGQNIVDIEASPVEGEVTAANNRVPLIVNGVRDRLRVLLVSGQPHAGGRTWRDMLTSDPGVDLVHFTILREPNKLDATPQNELSLIAFPFQELFEVKLYDFDLIIFDRYRLNRILPNYYFGNIARYVREGGALLEASGPDFASENSIYTTDLRQVLPAVPTGQVIEKSFKPSLTAKGKRHPVTENLNWPGGTDGAPGWGSWLRQVAVSPTGGDTVMDGADGLPLLILDRVGKGRVAQFASDQIWLWSRGYEGGGPQAELLRRLAHWLMKEPELEENALDARIEGSTLLVKKRSMTDDPVDTTITAPDGTKQTLKLEQTEPGMMEARAPVTQIGVYVVDDGTRKRYALTGSVNPPELRGVLGTEEKLAPAARESKGGIVWLSRTPDPGIRALPAGRNYGGTDWVGLRSNSSYNVTGVRSTPLLPGWLCALVLLAAVIGCWWLEGRSTIKA